MEFIAIFKIGKGNKERELIVSGDTKSLASVEFINKSPKGSYLISLEPKVSVPKPVKTYTHLMKVENAFDKFIVQCLERKKMKNQELLELFKISRAHWNRNRSNPSNFRVGELNNLAKILDVSLSDLFTAVKDSL